VDMSPPPSAHMLRFGSAEQIWAQIVIGNLSFLFVPVRAKLVLIAVCLSPNFFNSGISVVGRVSC
jgi:hypothetical protein